MIRTLAPRRPDGSAPLSAKPLPAVAHSSWGSRPITSKPAARNGNPAGLHPSSQMGYPMVRKQSNGRAPSSPSARATSPSQRTPAPAGPVVRRTSTSTTTVAPRPNTPATSLARRASTPTTSFARKASTPTTTVARNSSTPTTRAAERPAPQAATRRDSHSAPTPTPTQASKPRTFRPDVSAPARSTPNAKDHEILHQSWFKSVGPRTYAVQLRRAANGNHALVLIEGKRDEQTHELKKHSLYVWSEDFGAFFKMLQEAVGAIKAHPVPDEVKKRRAKYWARKNDERADADDTTEAVVPARPPRRR